MPRSSRFPLLAAASFLTLLPAAAQATDPGLAREVKGLTVSRLGDTELSCAALEQEAIAMRAIIRAKQSVEDNSELKSRSIGAAGAVGSLLLGTVTAGVGLAAAGFLATEAVEEEADRADSLKEIAAQRRSLMVGIYHAKGCTAPIDHVMDDKPVKKTRAVTMVSSTEEARTAAPIAAAIAPSSGRAPTFRFNE